MGSRKNNKSRKKRGGHSPYTVNVTGYYKPEIDGNKKLVDIVVNNKQDSDKYFNTYKVYPDEPTLINDLKDFVNIDKDEIENMNYRLKPFFDTNLDKTSELIPKQSIIVVNNDKDMAKVKTANEIIEKLNEMKGGSLFGKKIPNKRLSKDDFLKLMPEDLDKFAPGDIDVPKDIENNPDIIKQLQRYYFANIVKEDIYKDNDNFKNLLKTNAFFNIIAKKIGLIRDYIPLKWLDETKEDKHATETVLKKLLEQPQNQNSINTDSIILENVNKSNFFDNTKKRMQVFNLTRKLNSETGNLNNEIAKILGTDLKSSLVNGINSVKTIGNKGIESITKGIDSAKVYGKEGLESVKTMGNKGIESITKGIDSAKVYGNKGIESVKTQIRNNKTKKAIRNITSANTDLNNIILKIYTLEDLKWDKL
jgi:hypothetical protein